MIFMKSEMCMAYFLVLILLGMSKISMATTRHDYLCKRNEFIEYFVKRNVLMNSSDIEYQQTQCGFNNSCKYEAFPWINFGEVGRNKIQIGGWDTTKYDGDCWKGYLLIQRNKTSDMVQHTYYGFLKNETENDFRYQYALKYDNDVILDLFGYPYKFIQRSTYKMPKTICEKNVRYLTARYYWNLLSKTNYTCDMYVEDNTQSMAEFLCSSNNSILNENPTDFEIAGALQKYVYLKQCSLSFKREQPKEKVEVSTNLDVTTIAVIVSSILTIVLCIILFIFHQYIRRHKRNHFNQQPSKDGAKSVFILYPVGCEQLEKFVQSLSLIIHSLGHNVKSYLHNKNIVDGTIGGVMPFYFDCINTCDCVIVVFMKHVTKSNIDIDGDEDYSKALVVLEQLKKQTLYVTPAHKKQNKDQPSIDVTSENTSLLLHIPKDINKLINVFQTDRNVVDVLLKKVEIEQRYLMSDKHANCCRATCVKGLISVNDADKELLSETMSLPLDADVVGSLKCLQWVVHTSHV